MKRLLVWLAPLIVASPAAIGSAGEGAPTGGAWTAKADGARLVACGAALVTASAGSRASFSCDGGATVSLGDGAFRVVAGSKGVRIAVGGTKVELSNARVRIARVGGKWLARGEPDGEAPLPGPLASGGVVWLGAPEGGALAEGDAAAFERAVALSRPIPEPRRALRARRVEAPIAAGPRAVSGAAEAAQVEIEAIEVEVGCIEVCVD